MQNDPSLVRPDKERSRAANASLGRHLFSVRPDKERSQAANASLGRHLFSDQIPIRNAFARRSIHDPQKAPPALLTANAREQNYPNRGRKLILGKRK